MSRGHLAHSAQCLNERGEDVSFSLLSGKPSEGPCLMSSFSSICHVRKEIVLLSTLLSISTPKLPKQKEVEANKRNWKVLLIVLIVFKTTIIYSS